MSIITKLKSKKISHGAIHRVPTDLRKVLTFSPKMLLAWESLTPLARNEWICRLTTVKKLETRKQHLKRVEEDLMSGKRRPCCWPGCPHR